jgi:hypothetical protein
MCPDNSLVAEARDRIQYTLYSLNKFPPPLSIKLITVYYDFVQSEPPRDKWHGSTYSIFRHRPNFGDTPKISMFEPIFFSRFCGFRAILGRFRCLTKSLVMHDLNQISIPIERPMMHKWFERNHMVDSKCLHCCQLRCYVDNKLITWMEPFHPLLTWIKP